MSVINETLDNLKQKKKRNSLNPSSSSFYNEKALKSEKNTVSNRSYIIPISFAVLVGLLFYISHLLFSTQAPQTQRKEHPSKTISWFKSNLKKHTASNQKSQKPVMIENKAAQKMYYEALVLLNEGKEDQALEGLQKIIAQYPDFVPAQKVHAMLMTG